MPREKEEKKVEPPRQIDQLFAQALTLLEHLYYLDEGDGLDQRKKDQLLLFMEFCRSNPSMTTMYNRQYDTSLFIALLDKRTLFEATDTCQYYKTCFTEFLTLIRQQETEEYSSLKRVDAFGMTFRNHLEHIDDPELLKCLDTSKKN